MPSLKEIKTRIASVNSTRKITSAMKMVASSKIASCTGGYTEHAALREYAGTYPQELPGEYSECGP